MNYTHSPNRQDALWEETHSCSRFFLVGKKKKEKVNASKMFLLIDELATYCLGIYAL